MFAFRWSQLAILPNMGQSCSGRLEVVEQVVGRSGSGRIRSGVVVGMRIGEAGVGRSGAAVVEVGGGGGGRLFQLFGPPFLPELLTLMLPVSDLCSSWDF